MQISSHGLVRLSMEELLSTSIAHLVSGLDEEPELSLRNCGRPTEISGYTEWVGKEMPFITIGWDWQLHVESSRVLWKRASFPRSNIMLLDDSGEDTSVDTNLRMLATLTDSLHWPEEVLRFVSTRYI